MKTVDWYLDFISPFAYIASRRLNLIDENVQLVTKPVLFAGILNHYDTKGPAEIERMRQYTFRHVTWIAEQHNIPLTLPPAHPFNPLKLLRLAIYLDCKLPVIDRIFRFVWEEGCSADNDQDWKRLTHELSVTDADEKISQPHIKNILTENTQEAVSIGVFGVPTFLVDGELFFGQDSLPFLKSYLEGSGILESKHMKAADNLPQGISRKIN